MRTILTIKQQHEFLSSNPQLRTLTHKWSCRGYGNSNILDTRDNRLARATGCGYDRFGTVVGQFIELMFQDELNKLAKRECKQGVPTRYTSAKYYGLFYNAHTKQAYVDGGCGDSCMRKILNRIGFELNYLAATDRGQVGETFYSLEPLSAHARKYH